MQWIRSHLSFANSISLIALFVALGGTSLAAVTLTKNSVGAKQIKKNAVRASEINKNAVRASEIKASAVRSSEVKDGSLLLADFGAGQIPQGAKGDTGSFDPATTVITVQRTDIALPAGPDATTPGTITSAFANCLSTQKMIGGSVNVGDAANAEVLISRPSRTNTGSGTVPNDAEDFSFWKGTGRARKNTPETMRVFAICAEKPATP
jgi:hypothetical protein